MAKRASRGVSFSSQVNIYKQVGTVDLAISALSNANPAVATATAHGLTTGAAVYVESAANEAADGNYLVRVLTEDTFELIGMDSTDFGVVTDAKYAVLDAYTFCDASSIKIEAMKTKQTDATTNCDDGPVTELEKDAGNISIGALWSPDKAVHEYLDECFEDILPIFITFKPKNTKTIFGFNAAITSFSIDGQANEKWKSSFELVVNGRKRKLTLGA